MADHLYALPSGYRLEQYEFREVLSLGTYGIKYQAFDHEAERQVAIKEYLPDGIAARRDDTSVVPRSSADAQAFEVGLGRFLDEARMQTRIEHPNLVKVHRALRANGTGYVVMDYVEGETLAQLLKRRSTLAEDEFNAVIGPLLGPLEMLHGHGFLHQDIRPGHIVVREDGASVLLEIGGARQVHGGARQAFNRGRAADLVVPTAGFSALEQYSSRSRLGPWTDIYALGAVMYNCIAGHPPPDAPSRVIEDEMVPAAQAARGSYSENTLQAIDQGLAVAGGERPASVAAWRANLPFATGSRGVTPRGTVRVAARGGGLLRRRGDGAANSDAKRNRRASWQWVGPIAALVVVIALITYTDVGVLRSPGDQQAVAAPAASAAPAAALLATLVVRSEPEGADVYLGDRQLGATPLEVPNLEPGQYDLSLQHPRYERLDLEQALPAGETTIVERELVRATGSLAVETMPAGAWIEIDGERLTETTPTTLRLPTGPTTLFVAAQGYHREQVQAVVPRNDLATVEVALRASIAYGTLTLALTPADAEVLLPDVEPTYNPGLELVEGAYRVVVSRPGFVTEDLTVDVVGDTEFAVALAADPQPFTVVAAPADAWIRFPTGDATYSPAMRLLPGDYRVQAVRVGYETFDETISHGNEPTQRVVSLTPGVAEFSDRLAGGGDGPAMVLVPAGAFRMGCLASAGCRDSELPTRDVAVQASFALAKREVTFADYDRFSDATGRSRASSPRGWERASTPAVNVSWQDAVAYADWLTTQTGRRYRLPSESEWEYAARSGTSTAYSWGDAIGDGRANCNGCDSRWDNIRAAPVGSFLANPWGLQDMHGNVWEWVQDCYNASHEGAPANESARTDGDCNRRVLRGGSWANSPGLLRAPTREWDDVTVSAVEIGFRVAADFSEQSAADVAGGLAAVQPRPELPPQPDFPPQPE